MNKDVVVEHLANESLIALRLVYDRIKSSSLKIHELLIDRKLILTCLSTQDIQNHCPTKKETAVEDKKSRQRKLKQEQVQRSQMAVEKSVKTLQAEIKALRVYAIEQKDSKL